MDFSYGLKTGDDPKFISNNRRDSDSKPLLRSADVYRYTSRYHGEFVWYRPDLMTKNKSTARPGDKERFERPKLIVSRMGRHLVATLDDKGYFVKDGMLLAPKDDSVSLHYILGLLNSRLLNYYYRNFFVTIDVLKNALLSLPVPKRDKAREMEIGRLASKLLRIQEGVSKSGNLHTDQHRLSLEEAASAEHSIDTLVYELYGLSAAERHMVEAQSNLG